MFGKLIQSLVAKLKGIFGKKQEKPRKSPENSQERQEENADSRSGNKAILSSQIRMVILALILAIFGGGVMVHSVQKKAQEKEPAITSDELKLELADKRLDPEKMWRNHYEDELKKVTDNFNEKLKEQAQQAEQEKKELKETVQAEMSALTQQLKIAREELLEGARGLEEAGRREQELLASRPAHSSPVLGVQEFGDHIEYDIPKPLGSYVPEGVYFTGYLHHGLVVSTALNNAEENPVRVTIRLTERGNLPLENKIDIKNCRITGTAKGDLSSERATIRLEKLHCMQDGMSITSEIAGEVIGPDGANGIKGSVVSTGSKHIKNAILGGLISGLSSSAKGQEGVNLTAGGAVSTKSMGFKDMAKSGMLTGAGNAGEKLADHFLRYAESMSPVLVIPAGVRVNPVIGEGFFMGQINTHRAIRAKREQNKRKQEQRQKQNSGQNYRQEGSWSSHVNSGEIKE